MVDFKEQRVAACLVVGKCVANYEYLVPRCMQLEAGSMLEGLFDYFKA